MGILIVKLREFRFANQTETNSELKHVMVLEEAHNILKRCSHETSQDSGNVEGAAVGALVDSIAEMRSSGQGFMIIDQSPGAVDEAALKNTAIKIVMRLPEKNDCEAIGSTMSLTDEQLRELSRLDKGVAVVYHEGWEEPVMGKMGQIWADTPHAKTFKRKTVPLDRGDMLRAKGAIIQWVCSIYEERNVGWLETKSEFSSFWRQFFNKKYASTLNDNLRQDIEDAIQLFIEELKDNFGNNLSSYPSNRYKKLRPIFGNFIRRFLQIDGIFKLVPLKLTKYDPTNVLYDPKADPPLPGPTPKQTSEIMAWWMDIKPLLSRYVLFPRHCNIKNLQWTTDTFDGEYINLMCQMVLYSFAKEYTRNNSGDSRYECAYFTLCDLGILK